jgi:hypothetical protein
MGRARRRKLAVLAVVGTMGLAGCSPLVPIAHGPHGEPADGRGYPASISDDGQVISYTSDASNLVPGDTNGVTDVFVLDRRTHRTVRADVSSTGAQANDRALTVGRISGNGRAVTFVSGATNLVPGDTDGVDDIFVHDLRTGATERVSVGTDGRQITGLGPRGSVMSDDARFVAFTASGLDPANRWRSGIYVHDRRRHRTRLVPGPALPPDAVLGTFSGDGHVLVYLVGAADGSGVVPVVRDLRTGRDDRIVADRPFASEYTIDIDDAGRTITWGGRSWDGLYTGLVVDRRTRSVETLATTTGGHCTITVSSTGRYVATFTDAGPAAGLSAAIRVLDRRRGTSTPVGVGYWVDLSDDGRAATVETADQEGPFLWLAPRRR